MEPLPATATITSFSDTMNRFRRTAQRDGSEIEFWSAREIYGQLGYEKWENFAEVIGKAKENCKKVQVEPQHHFADIRKMITIGNGATREQTDIVLSRTACYLIALNANPAKAEIAWAKAYFIVQTRAQEIEVEKLTDTEERLALRENLTKANKQLAGAAKEAGVANFGHFHAAGIRGLYGMNQAALRAKKGISPNEDYWDRVSGLELSANDFKAQLAKKSIEQKTRAGEIKGQKQAEQEHERIGQSVRATVRKETGMHIEDLPSEPSLKKLLAEQKKASKAAQKGHSAILGSPSTTEQRLL